MKQLVRIAPFFLAAFASTCFSACGPTRPPRGLDNPDLIVGSLSQVNPLDIVVLPIQNNTGRENLPLAQLRQEFHKGMVRQKYSPLSLEFVDARVVEAAYKPGDLQEQAILQVNINSWDDSQWRSLQRLHIEAEVYLLDSRNPDPRQPLWGGKVDRRIDLAREMTGLPNNTVAMGVALQQFTENVLASLPPRNPEKQSL
ncbi:MAG TPA: hypothetical protein VM509_03325 [Planctomycetota bacterium]|nr:hypothetical protein [Planctomycetota bacterium]